MLQQILRFMELRRLRQVARRGDDFHFEVAAQPDGNHILMELFTETNSGIKTCRNDIDQSVISDDIQLNFGVALHKAAQQRRQIMNRGDARNIEAQAARRRAGRLGIGHRILESRQRRGQPLHHALAGLARRDAARGPV